MRKLLISNRGDIGEDDFKKERVCSIHPLFSHLEFRPSFKRTSREVSTLCASCPHAQKQTKKLNRTKQETKRDQDWDLRMVIG